MATTLTMKIPVPMLIVVTWIAIQYDRRAGTSGAAGEYSTVPARNSSTTTGSSRNMPR